MSKPAIKVRAAEPVCPECGGKVTRRNARGPFPTFCSDEHKRDFGNRQIIEGRALVAFVKAWRIERGTGEIAKGAFAQICEIADQFNAADRLAGRPRADLYAAKLLASGTNYRDRQPQN